MRLKTSYFLSDVYEKLTKNFMILKSKSNVAKAALASTMNLYII